MLHGVACNTGSHTVTSFATTFDFGLSQTKHSMYQREHDFATGYVNHRQSSSSQ